MEEFEKIRKLIRLKRHETPPEDFVDHFIQTFRDKQRTELMKRSVWSMMKERIDLFFDDLLVPKWALAVGVLTLAAVMAWAVFHGADTSVGNVAAVDKGSSLPGVAEGSGARSHRGEPFVIDGVRIMMEVENQMEIQQSELAQHLDKGHGADMIVVPTGNGMGIAVPVEKFVAAYNQSAAK
jgi:hypothetical protein